MTSTLWLDRDDVQRAYETFDPVMLIVADLRAPNGGETQPGSATGDDVLIVEDGGVSYALPLHALRTVYRACLAAAVVRRLSAPRIATVGLVVLRSWDASAYLNVFVRRVPEVTHVAVCAGEGQADVPERIRDELFMAGATLAAEEDAREALFGANLVVVDGFEDASWLDQVSAGTVIVNVSDDALPANVVKALTMIYGVAGANRPPVYRRHYGREMPRFGDLFEILRSDEPIANRSTDVCVIDLNGVDAISRELTLQIGKTARGLGLGRWTHDVSPPRNGE
ncbi:hypothetical protein [Spongiactinospora sp. TRM90649]|uniref:hypothetical protein n=1 Tax=Spongiactinospora sp. TRM90649 TaxID=3031114 RepID=UPI0023F68876|nr:hypothetical protein [Spongiactinospora sp. TRM90649]MDF5753540.1 hypothetical protein [Spongiactinospora sp. TRM90649]